jgi:signal transduction histidine kinase
MSKTAWYRSLYWRIGIGFVLFLAGVLAAQAFAMMWLISRMEMAPGPPPPVVTRLVADELSALLEANPQFDIEEYFRDEYREQPRLVAIMADGRVISSDGTPPPEDLVAAARVRLMNAERSFPSRESRFDPGRGTGRGRGRGPGPGRGESVGAIRVNGKVAGLVIATPRSPFEQLGPMLAGVGLLLVAGGTAGAALLIFGPVRRRLRSLEESARRVGAGDLSARAREDGGDEVAAVAHTFNEMTKDLGSRSEQLHAADRARRALFADVSHELMTPLTAMRGYLETLGMQNLTLREDTRARYLSIIGDETQKLERLVGDLLDLSRLEGGGESLDLQDVPVESLFGRVAARHEREADSSGVVLATIVAPGAEIVYGDPLRLEQALQNLAANALRHTPPGGRIDISAASQPPDMVITVRDSGCGIPPEHLPFVFDRFYKADPSRGAGGSGLGLSIVKAIIDKHGGRISVESKVAEGTTFVIRLPNP